MHHQGANKKRNRGKKKKNLRLSWATPITYCREVDVVREDVNFYEENCQLGLVVQPASPVTREAEEK